MPHKRHSKWSRRRHYREPYKRRRGSKVIAGAIIGAALVVGLALYSGVLQVNPDVLEQSVGEISGGVSRDDTDTDTVVMMGDSGPADVQMGADLQEPSGAAVPENPVSGDDSDVRVDDLEPAGVPVKVDSQESEVSLPKDTIPDDNPNVNVADDPRPSDFPTEVDPPDPSEMSVHNIKKSADTIIENLEEMPELPGNHYDDREYLEKLHDYALLLVNQDRIKHYLKPVEMSVIYSGQEHTDQMLRHGFFSHWYIDGTKPYVSYTKHGGRGLVAENACPQYIITNHMEAIQSCQHSMMYDDAHADWGHRDNILDPYHTHVNFGISFDGNNLYFVQQFENNLIDMRRLEVADGILKLESYLMPGYEIYGISIYNDSGPRQLTGHIIETESPYTDNSYDYGTFAGMIVEESPWPYVECAPGVIETLDGACVPYSTYQLGQGGNGYVRMTADVSMWLQQNGLHTMHISLTTPDGKIVPATALTLEYL